MDENLRELKAIRKTLEKIERDIDALVGVLNENLQWIRRDLKDIPKL